jgi:hypothetical protein
MEKTFDSKCYDLAEHFLQDEPNIIEEDLTMLAWLIQQVIEDYLDDLHRSKEES